MPIRLNIQATSLLDRFLDKKFRKRRRGCAVGAGNQQSRSGLVLQADVHPGISSSGNSVCPSRSQIQSSTGGSA